MCAFPTSLVSGSKTPGALPRRGRNVRDDGAARAKVLEGDNLSEMFGIEMAPATPKRRGADGTVPAKRSATVTAAPTAKNARLSAPEKPDAPVPMRWGGRQRLTTAKRRAISERMKKYWAARRRQAKKGVR